MPHALRHPHRQHGNLEDCFGKLQELVDAAVVKPKVRRHKTALSGATKAAYVKEKRFRSEVKARRSSKFDY